MASYADTCSPLCFLFVDVGLLLFASLGYTLDILPFALRCCAALHLSCIGTGAVLGLVRYGAVEWIGLENWANGPLFLTVGPGIWDLIDGCFFTSRSRGCCMCRGDGQIGFRQNTTKADTVWQAAHGDAHSM
ncbi:hypothetical protein IWX49DRAFT_367942 [Phyllosticta citricarpa]|uniref:Uncharacterized protein n=1 Tax=Phyllosticta citricarpa TaxID=55181 RepID=A0ABR1MK95_9PEZI